jgi:hypothetical protein
MKKTKPELTEAKAKVNVEAEVSLCERVDINKVVSAHGLASGWFWSKMGDKPNKWDYLAKYMSKEEGILFKKFYNEVGCHQFAKWLWENKRAMAHEDRQGYIVVVFANKKKKNSVIWQKRKRASN